MPLFMDRHDVRDATAEAVAEAHKQDLRVQEKHSCRAHTYWFDEQRGTAFCLIEAPNEAAIRAMHREAHGLIPNVVVEVEPSAVAAFLGRVTDPIGAGNAPLREAGFRALMFTDIADSTRLTNVLGDARAQVVIATHNTMVRRALLAHDGREIDRAGDGFLACFATVSQCVRCAIEIQQDLARHNRESNDHRLMVRIGLGAGEPVTDGVALFGSAVNLAARVCAAACPGQIACARLVRDLCTGKEFAFSSLGTMDLKGFDEPVELFAVQIAGRQ